MQRYDVALSRKWGFCSSISITINNVPAKNIFDAAAKAVTFAVLNAEGWRGANIENTACRVLSH